MEDCDVISWLLYVVTGLHACLILITTFGCFIVNVRKLGKKDSRNDQENCEPGQNTLRLENSEEQIQMIKQDFQKEKTEKYGTMRRLENSEEQIQMIKQDFQKEKTEKYGTMRKLENSVEQIQKLKKDLQKEKTEKDDALKRLSALMSNRLRDGNPNVVDLSDQNRPLKVGEQFSELYDNQWTDAFSAVHKHLGDKKTETEVIQILLEIVEQCFEMCKQATETEMLQMQNDVHAICATVATDGSKLAADLLQRIKEERKLNAVGRIPDFEKAIGRLKPNVASSDIATFFDKEEVGIYVQECLKLCHLMVHQDPPMMIESKPDFRNAENFKAYLTRGQRIAYVVWPILFLHEGGPLVSKGVAEFGS